MISQLRRATAAVLLSTTAILASGGSAGAQTDSVKAPAPEVVPKPAAAGPSLSGTFFLNYQSGGTRAERAADSPNRFEVDRAYLTVRAPAGEHLRVRLTADVFQQRNAASADYYGGWSYRLKYAYGQYDYLRGARLRGEARLGMLQTTIIEHEEGFWNRGLGPTAVDREGFFSSADLGATTTLSVPGRGEMFVGVFNGNGYQSRETDRFKDVGARLTITPLSGVGGPLRSLAISPWIYVGRRASAVDPARDGLRRDRFGVHAGVANSRVTVGVQAARRIDAADAPAGSAAAPSETRGNLLSGYAFVRPLGFLGGGSPGALTVMGRVDEVDPDASAAGRHRFVVAGLGWDLTRRAQLWLDFQGQEARDGSRVADLKTLFARAIVSF